MKIKAKMTAGMREHFEQLVREDVRISLAEPGWIEIRRGNGSELSAAEQRRAAGVVAIHTKELKSS